MSHRISILLGVLAGWLVSSAAWGQVVEADPSEKTQATVVKPAPDKIPDLSKAVEQIIQRTNEFRTEEGRSKVEVNPKLTEAAQYFADFMAKTGKYGHTADGSRPADRAKKYGYEYCMILENIAYQYRSEGFQTEELAKVFFEGWKKSPGHRKNMLDADVLETAVAVARSEDTGYFYAVQMFGRPKSKAIEFTIANQTETAVEYQIGDETFSLPPRYVRTHQRCRSEALAIQLPASDPSSKSETKTVTPSNGDRFLISNDKQGYQIKKQ